ncbi:MAG TPA: alanine racemase [Microscillaceae bacterium]|nr:alanine racemase [Microscillaceae bacterium]
MNHPYFQQLNRTLQSYKRAVPSLLIDLDRLDQNLDTFQKSIRPEIDFRIVVKSLPSIPLLDYVMEKTSTNRLMVFHQPFLSTLAHHYGDKITILLGKPMPVQTTRYFYESLDTQSAFQPRQQLQWLIDTETRLRQYLELAQQFQQKLLINLEIDIGLHRGGFGDLKALRTVLQLIATHSEYLTFSGFMGYDPHVAALPKALRSPQKSFRLANHFYKSCIDLVKTDFPELWQDGLTFNGAGSPTLAFHQHDSSILNEVAAGSALVKPTHFDIPTLAHYVPACFIATPILKKMQGTTLPLLEKLKGVLNVWKPAFKQSYFIYGGYWKADFCYPPKTSINTIFGPSTNQSMINTAAKVDLNVDDFVFLRPTQSEFVFLQFGDILAIRNGKVVDHWKVLQN